MPRRRTDAGRERADAFVARNARRSQKRRLAREKAARAEQFAQRLVEVPTATLSAYEHYAREMARRRGSSRNVLRPIEEHRKRTGVPE